MQRDALPALDAQLASLHAQHAQALEKRAHVERVLPADASPDAARELVDAINADVRAQLERLEREAADRGEREEAQRRADATAAQLRERQTRVHTAVATILSEVRALLARYAESAQRPASLEDAEADARNMDALQTRLGEARAHLQGVTEWLAGDDAADLPQAERDAALEAARAELARLDADAAQLSTLGGSLDAELTRQRQLADEHAQLTLELNALRDEAAAANASADAEPERASAQLAAVQTRAEPLLRQVDALEEQLAPSPSTTTSTLTLVRREQPLEADALRTHVAQLQSSVDAGHKQAARAAELARVERHVDEQRTQLRADVRSAEELLADPDASVEQLRRSSAMLAEARPRLDALRRQYDDLPDDDEDARAAHLRNRTADALRSLGELFDANEQSALERVDALLARQQEQLGARVERAQQTLADAQASPEDYEEHSALLLTTINEARALVAPFNNDDAGADAEQAQQAASLTRALELAADTRRAIDERADLWRRFREQRDIVGDKQDTARRPFEAVQAKGMRAPSDVAADLNDLKVSARSERLVSASSRTAAACRAINSTSRPSKQTSSRSPRSASSCSRWRSRDSELRFLETEQVNLKDDSDELMALLAHELDDEAQLAAATERAVGELRRLRGEAADLSADALTAVQRDALPALDRATRQPPRAARASTREARARGARVAGGRVAGRRARARRRHQRGRACTAGAPRA